jgi:hypothetical protein
MDDIRDTPAVIDYRSARQPAVVLQVIVLHGSLPAKLLTRSISVL